MTESHSQTVVVAGATGDLGGRITEHLVRRGATGRALFPVDAPDADRERVAGGSSPGGPTGRRFASRPS